MFEEYEKIANKSIEDSINSETHGSLEEAMLTVGKSSDMHIFQATGLTVGQHQKNKGPRDVTAREIIHVTFTGCPLNAHSACPLHPGTAPPLESQCVLPRIGLCDAHVVPSAVWVCVHEGVCA